MKLLVKLIKHWLLQSEEAWPACERPVCLLQNATQGNVVMTRHFLQTQPRLNSSIQEGRKRDPDLLKTGLNVFIWCMFAWKGRGNLNQNYHPSCCIIWSEPSEAVLWRGRRQVTAEKPHLFSCWLSSLSNVTQHAPSDTLALRLWFIQHFC